MDTPLFTCLSCAIGFSSAEDQRASSDPLSSDRSAPHPLHRHTLPLRSPPVQHEAEGRRLCPPSAPPSSPRSSTSAHSPTPERHTRQRTRTDPTSTPRSTETRAHLAHTPPSPTRPPSPPTAPVSSAPHPPRPSKTISPTCPLPTRSSSPTPIISSTSPASVSHLAEKIAVGNVCIYCNGRGRELHTLEAVRKHMVDKGHCKIAYDTEIDRLEISDYYDFTPSYPSGTLEWEDVDQDTLDDDDDLADAASDHPDHLPDNQLAYGNTEYELVLPSGARIGHRSMMRYYAQSFHGIPAKPEDPNSGAALVRRLLANKHSALVPRKGGFGAFGQGTQVVKARNNGEAREAGRHIREFRDQRRREDFKTKVALVHNNQKHFRDPLLQIFSDITLK
ncbi:cytoplasmic protein [Butyriboletus roseoflavus]|nr:cytoplasmic protein [Butyriboletus roseoflavus]